MTEFGRELWREVLCDSWRAVFDSWREVWGGPSRELGEWWRDTGSEMARNSAFARESGRELAREFGREFAREGEMDVPEEKFGEAASFVAV